MVNRKYSAALCGLGNIAWKFGSAGNAEALSHADAFVAHPQVELVAGCSPCDDDRKAFQGAHTLPVFEDLDDMLASSVPDIVSICSPTSFHFEQIKACLLAEVPMIWLEKPPSETSWELKELIELREARGCRSTVVVNYQRRYTDCYLRLKQAFNGKVLGRPVRVSVNYSRGLSVNGVHFLDQIFFLLGDAANYDVEWVSKKSRSASPSMVLRFGDVEVVVQGDELGYHNNDISVTFEEGRLSVLYGGEETSEEERVENEVFPGFYRLRPSKSNLLGRGGFGNSFYLALEDLIRGHEGGEECASTLRTALKSQQLLEHCLVRGV